MSAVRLQETKSSSVNNEVSLSGFVWIFSNSWHHEMFCKAKKSSDGYCHKYP